MGLTSVAGALGVPHDIKGFVKYEDLSSPGLDCIVTVTNDRTGDILTCPVDQYGTGGPIYPGSGVWGVNIGNMPGGWYRVIDGVDVEDVLSIRAEIDVDGVIYFAEASIVTETEVGSQWVNDKQPMILHADVILPIEVDIDIKPGSWPNAINLGSNGVIPIAILSSEDFDATQVDPATVALAGAGVAVRGKGNKSMAHQEDVNEDGLVDLVVQVVTENLDPTKFQDGLAILTGNLLPEFGGTAIEGSDEIIIVPPG